MTQSVFQELRLVQVLPDGAWYVAFPHPELEGVLLVDVARNLKFSATYALEELAAVQPVLACNRFISVRLPCIPGMVEASPFSLLVSLLHQNIQAIKEEGQAAEDFRSALILRVLTATLEAAGQGLHQALTQLPERPESIFIEHDFLVHQLHAWQREARAMMGASQEVELDEGWASESG
jgi:hypothetical protein